MACGNGKNSSNQEEQSSDVREELLLFTQKGLQENRAVGSLHIQTFNGKPELIGERVVQGKFAYDNETGQVLFINDEGTLFLYEGKGEAIEIARDVAEIRGNGFLEDGRFLYIDTKDNLYLATKDSSIYVGTGVWHFDVVSEDIYYTNYRDEQFVRLNTETLEKQVMEDNVARFEILSDEGELLYTINNGGLYYKGSKEEDSILVTPGDVQWFSSYIADDYFYFLEEAIGTDQEMSLNRVKLEGEFKIETIVNHVTSFEISDENVYYTSPDFELFKMTDAEATPERLATDIIRFSLLDEGILLVDTELNYTLYNEENQSETILGTDIFNSYLTETNHLFYINGKRDLFYGDSKLSSSISHVSFFKDRIVYEDEETLFLKDDEIAPVEIDIDLNAYTTIYYQNQLVYENLLEMNDLVGVYRYQTSFNEEAYLEFAANNQLILHEENQVIDLIAGFNTPLLLEMTSDNGDTVFVNVDGNRLIIQLNGQEIVAEPAEESEIE